MMKVACVVFVSLIFLVQCASADSLVGGWSPIENISDPHVLEIADFAVTEYDKRTGATLKLDRVIKGETQVVAGANYRLLLAANDASATKNYQAVVWEKPWEHFRNLTSFNPAQA